jgi:hypothetical protein
MTRTEKNRAIPGYSGLKNKINFYAVSPHLRSSQLISHKKMFLFFDRSSRVPPLPTGIERKRLIRPGWFSNLAISLHFVKLAREI